MESTGKVGRVSLPALAPLPVDCPVRQKKIPILYKQLYFEVSLRQQFIEVKEKKKSLWRINLGFGFRLVMFEIPMKYQNGKVT